jgi:hypothetical protein
VLQHLRSPGGTGCLLRGGLTLTATGLTPVSRQQLSGHTSGYASGPWTAKPPQKAGPGYKVQRDLHLHPHGQACLPIRI